MQGTEKDLMGKLETAEMVLVGTGEEFEAESSQDISYFQNMQLQAME